MCLTAISISAARSVSSERGRLKARVRIGAPTRRYLAARSKWLGPGCGTTSRFPCCARTRTSIKADRGAAGPLVIRDGARLLKRKDCYALTSVRRRRGEIRQLPEDRHLRGDAWVYRKRSDTRRPLSAQCVAAVQRDDASDKSSLYETRLDMCKA